ncbi:DUF938 domain-containing protein [Altererythrobacter sp.]|uniref:DUF938 domain-containing protein n=1 Tax=Altererythrobacter sp. TaxID=1872480 RepID=UPI001B147983|nr:DUF938 domain-containing protein [Altererythrobacter sp.]MBO6609818.1 DUF938 domain-containing protein [Altererythrobacter sp.]MBO6640980.1 DUF938 domain-containing protein [Altererythrobacter sp.]MBO6708322.1 DUF938 domain-containing protein [Altererythrobacter sp.]MBO6945542.1 DUF938 domain-containing protein [Altererythrobacter sp.]
MYASRTDDKKRYAPATLRNREAISDVLALELPEAGLVLEVASGSGEHAHYFSERFPSLDWQPSDPDPAALASIEAWRADHGRPNLLPPIELNGEDSDWALDHANAIFCANMVHIAPWEACEGMFAGAARLLPYGAPLILYGPYLEEDVETAPSNLAFDASLKSRNPSWGLRNVADIEALGTDYGFARTARYEMPANNLTLVYRRSGET